MEQEPCAQRQPDHQDDDRRGNCRHDAGNTDRGDGRRQQHQRHSRDRGAGRNSFGARNGRHHEDHQQDRQGGQQAEGRTPGAELAEHTADRRAQEVADSPHGRHQGGSLGPQPLRERSAGSAHSRGRPAVRRRSPGRRGRPGTPPCSGSARQSTTPAEERKREQVGRTDPWVVSIRLTSIERDDGRDEERGHGPRVELAATDVARRSSGAGWWSGRRCRPRAGRRRRGRPRPARTCGRRAPASCRGACRSVCRPCRAT